jgi:CspA family cold shock protein
LKGTVVRWLTGKGYGFIEPDGGGKDIFVHHSQVEESFLLAEGQVVEFDMEYSDKGPRAIKVRIIDNPER